MGLFTTADPFLGASLSVRKSLAQMDTFAPKVQRIIAAAKRLGVEYQCPIWREDAVAHIGFPDKKVAIYIVQGAENAAVADARLAWEKYGFKLLGADRKKILRATVEEVAAVLQSFFETSSK